MERFDEQYWRPLGAGRYAVLVRMPWGELVPAQIVVASRDGWPSRPEAQDPHWSAYPVGPAVLAIRLLGELAGHPAPRLPALNQPKPATDAAPEEWSGRLAAAWACQ